MKFFGANLSVSTVLNEFKILGDYHGLNSNGKSDYDFNFNFLHKFLVIKIVDVSA